MGKITERLTELAKRCDDLSPLREPVRQILIDDNKARALAGTDVSGTPFARLAQSTLERRDGVGPPQAPQGATSKIITEYELIVDAGPGKLSFLGSWPMLTWLQYHITGTKRMPKRDPMGFRKVALDKIRELLSAHITR